MTEKKVLNSEEQEAIQRLKERLKGELDTEKFNDDLLFYRFLKARDFKLDAAEDMFRKHLEWRKERNIDTFLQTYTPPKVLKKYFAQSRIGYDKEGCLIRYIPVGKLDIRGITMCCKIADIEELHVYENESDTILLEEQSKKLGKPLYQAIYIYDFAEMTFAKATDKKAVEASIQLITTYLLNYPERLKAAYAINASMYFTIFFAVLKRFMPLSVLNKIHIFGTDGWKEELLKLVDAEELPAFLGGKKTDPDGNPLCKTFVSHGGIVPEKYYIHKSKRSLADMPDVKKIVLSRASFHEESIEVKEIHSLLEWEFETKCKDIGFGLYYQDVSSGKEKMVELVPIQRIDTDEYAESGVYKCEKEGTYVILFDNTYSWIRQKEIFFKISVISPEEHDEKLKNYTTDFEKDV